jgi:F0F1-type ATP synthase epsilon subunit
VAIVEGLPEKQPTINKKVKGPPVRTALDKDGNPTKAALGFADKQGVISVRRKSDHPDDMMEHYAIDKGVIEVADNTVRVLVDEADKDSEVSAKEAEEALEAAKKLRAEARDQVSLDKAQSLVDRQTSRLKVAELRRRSRR